MKRISILAVILCSCFVLAAWAQQEEKGLKKVPIPYSNPTSGAQMYKNYCAACHGPKGMGDGPAVEFLKAAPPDLRTMTQRNNGKYPADRVKATLQFGTGGHAHGTSDMPIWGPLFRARDTDQNVGKLRAYNVTAFIESLQQK